MSDSSLLQQYQNHIWQPFTQMKLAPDPHFIARGEGARLYTVNGQEIIDAIGSWWVNIHGHAHPYINQTIRNQLEQLEHVIFAGLSHEPGVRLAARLSKTTADNLPYVYYSDNGSTAVEIALKMAYQFFQNAGQVQKKEFVALNGGYHGDTIGTMSVGARSTFHKMYADLLFDCHYIPTPKMDFSDFDHSDRAQQPIQTALQELETLLEQNGSHICGLIVEPLIQGASAGFAMYPAEYLKGAHALCKKHNVFFIADEVFTGSGRTGTYYACEQAGVWPDIMALSKGLSGGYLPFAATMCSQQIYDGFYSDDRNHTLFHGHSMTGNLLGCAAAHASLDLFESETSLQKVDSLEKRYMEYRQALLAGPLADLIQEIRVMGSVFALELKGDLLYTSDFGWRFMQESIKQGVLLRPLGKVIYMTPPYCITASELEKVFEVLTHLLHSMSR